MPILKDGNAITTLEEWEKHGHPKIPKHWADGHSAKEAARAWLAGAPNNLPPEVSSALAKHPDFGPVKEWDAEPEAKLRFDKFRGEPRNSDLVVHAKDSNGSYLIAVEAKADEPFGVTVAEALADAVDFYLEKSASNRVARIKQLAAVLLGPRRKGTLPRQGDPPLRDIRYQLLTACAGALCEAERREYSRALMLVHEFVTDKTTDKNHSQNAADLNQFIQRLSHGAVTTVKNGEIYGPFTVPGAPLLTPGKVKLYIGKVSRNLRTGGGVIHQSGGAPASGTPSASGGPANGAS